MFADTPVFAALLRAARTWGLAALALAVVGVAAADWAASTVPAVDDIVTGSIAGSSPSPRPRETRTRIIRSVLHDEPIVITETTR
jgi:hypothetical protein